MLVRLLCGGIAWLLLLSLAPARASVPLIPPVDGPVVVRFEEPEHEWAPGHRGIDYAVPEGTKVRAAGPGVVSFAGVAGSTRAVTIQHGAGYATTYSHLATIDVRAGDEVGQGAWLGTSGRAHPGGIEGIHLGVKLNGSYVDPAALMRTFDVGDAIHLAPLVWQPPAQMPDAFRSAFADAGSAEAPCRDAVALTGAPQLPPNDNVVVAIAGLGSSTRGGIRADMYEHGPEELGYAPDRIYPFSYAGARGPRLHRPYAAGDTFGDITGAAARLERLLRRIAERHPGADVDLLAHSMGGLVARRFLSDLAERAPGHLPRVEHLITFSTPHEGAVLAELPERLESKTLTGRWVVDGMSHWSRTRGGMPDPRSVAVDQLRPGSALLGDMAKESVVYGTKALTLAIPNDLIVTAERATWHEATARVVPPSGLNGHSSVVSSDVAQGLAYGFLRGAPQSCETGWDLWGPRLGRGIGFVEQQSYRGLVAAEELAIGRFVRVAKLGYKLARSKAGRAAGKAVGKLVQRSGVWLLNRERKEPPPPGGMGG